MAEETKLTMIDYVVETPAQVRSNVENSKALTQSLVDEYVKKDYKRVLIVACGSSHNGYVCGQPFLHKILKKEVKVIPPFNFVHFQDEFDDDDFIVVVSQSGRSTNAIEALELLKSRGHRTIGITSDVNSDFKDICDLTINWGVGVEKVGYVTKGVVTLALYFMLFGVEAQLAKGEITQEEADCYKKEFLKAMDAHEELQASANKYIESHVKDLYNLQEVYTISAGANLGTAIEAALKISETVMIHATAWECEEFQHGPGYPIQPRYTVIAYETGNDAANVRIEQIADAAKEIAGQVILVKCGASEDPSVISTNIKLMDEVMPLAYLAVAPMLANFASRKLSLQEHPLLKKFDEKVSTKSKKYPKNFGEW